MTGFTQKEPTQAPRLSPLRLGIGGPVGSGKTALTLSLCRRLKDVYNMAVITNDIYTKEDSEFLTRHDAMPAERIIGVETGGCPHTAIREDASINLNAVATLQNRFDGLELIIIESGKRDQLNWSSLVATRRFLGLLGG